MFIISIFLILPFISNNKVSASQRNNYEINIGNIQNVDDVGYLYTFDGSPDYIYMILLIKLAMLFFLKKH